MCKVSSTSSATLVIFCICFVSLYFNGSHPDGCKVVSYCVLICIFLMIRNGDSLLMCLLAIHTSMRKYLFNSFTQFWVKLFVFLLLNRGSSLYILNINSSSNLWFVNVFFCFLSSLFTLLFFFMKIMKSNLSICCRPVPLVLYSRNHCQMQCCKVFVLCFLLRLL